ncbi:GTPase Era [Spiroplasma turonicum]|uniref:GTPase Era n=1 Tax=Spiroplasma turonicum TaxID=216946 RepID=A0A0K1P5G6_9MOLU|nr:GTPase Era [Spiroplasma turonicum]AKU79523.1 GTP-binding protein Era [Spiroplasma turonicum]ALX70546.1 GTP-binding protein Era [Spiroplasma turonicum]
MSNLRSGFVSIIGRPNVGKSTLLNTILGQKISIVTNKAQTTRNRINGILTNDEYQMVFLDTPGVHTPKHELGKFMNKVALSSVKGVDVVIFMAPSNEKIGDNDKFVLKNLAKVEAPVFLIISKIDLVTKIELENKIREWKEIGFNFKEIICISSLVIESVNNLLLKIKNFLPNTGIKYYPDNDVTDQPERFLVRELIREELLLQTDQEVPYSIAILVDKIEDKPNILKILATIYCERKSQKPIIIGNKGIMIKNIGIESRKKLEILFNKQVYLELFVKVKEGWRSSPSLIKQLGYDKDTY